MIRTIVRYSICLLVLLGVGATSAHSTEPVPLRVLSYNIHHAEGIDRKLDLPRIAQVIQAARADLVALQEVDQNVERSNSIDQPAELARLTGLHSYFGANIELQGGRYGNLILSRFPIIERQNFSLPRMNAGEQRGVIVAEIQLPNRDQHLTFMATHLDHRRPADERLASAVFINKLVNEVRGPALLAGDLNDTFDSPTLDELEKSWKHVTEHPLATIPVSQPSRQIDFILYRPQHNWTVVETRVLDEATASDHRAIVTELVLPNL